MPIVRATITEAFEMLHASIVLKHVFPDSLLTSKFLMDVLSTASLHIPNAEDVHVCLLQDHGYCSKIIFRGDVKERCAAAIAPLLVLNTLTAVKDLVNKIKDDYNYIFPRHLQGNPNVLIGLLQTSQPYRSPIIISVIWDLFFSGNPSFVTKHQDQFPSRTGTNGDIIWEVPKAMVALVSIAYYAALCEWDMGEQKHHNFTSNMFLEAYNCHVSTLDKIDGLCNTSYHTMMMEIYQFAATSSTGMAQLPLSAPTLDLSVLED
ncbi:hypothetical protein V8E53_003215 [Lactarius tabidus]